MTTPTKIINMIDQLNHRDRAIVRQCVAHLLQADPESDTVQSMSTDQIISHFGQEVDHGSAAC